jgi:hypothetical protein
MEKMGDFPEKAILDWYGIEPVALDRWRNAAVF